MCGICGIYNLKNGIIEPASLKKMNEFLSHRGPDDEGYVLSEYSTGQCFDSKDLNFGSKSSQGKFNLGLGHKRLSIIDLSESAHQPMCNRNKDLWITYNGEVYNFKELRRELQTQGYEFTSKSDTEVVLYLYEQKKEDCLNLLNGVFAFTIWDAKEKKLFLARDRYGTKPLYYTIFGNYFIFASEVKAILYGANHPRKLDLNSLSEYFTFQNTFEDRTLFNGIKLLEPGHFLTIKDGVIKKTQYWDFNYVNSKNYDEEFCVSRIRDLLPSGVTRQLVSDVGVGAYLSGGMDSGTVVSLAGLRIPRLMTFTVGFDMKGVSSFEATFDERKDAELLSSHLGTEHYQMVIHAGDLEYALPKVIWHIEDLRVGMCYPGYYISRLASKFVKVALAGVGGDELFAGYPWRYKIAEESKTEQDFYENYFKYWTRLIPEEEKVNFFTPLVYKQIKDFSAFDKFIKIASKSPEKKDFIKKALYFEAKTFLHGLLVVEDKLSMANSLEVRVPLLDNNLVDFATECPTSYLIESLNNNNQNLNLVGKYIFRKAMSKFLSSEILNKPKQGLSAPEESWYKGKLSKYLEEILLGKEFLSRGFFQESYIRKILDEHLKGKINHRLLIWSLLSFEWWCKIFLDNENKKTQSLIRSYSYRR